MSDDAMRAPWHPIEGMPDKAGTWGFAAYREDLPKWRELRAQLENKALDKKIIDLWSEERLRAFAIETGQIEGLYVIPRGITMQLITEGLESVRLSHQALDQVADDSLPGLLQDQRDTLEMVFDIVAQRRPLSHATIKEWQHLLTRHQATAVGIDTQGRRVGIALLRGEYKRQPNNPRRPDGIVHEYCPPEQVRSEMERLFALYDEIQARDYPTEVEAAWLHHRYIQIHPFQDGNGRTARLLMAYAYIRRGEFPPLIPASEKDTYIDALEAADAGDLQPFVRYLGGLGFRALSGAIMAARKVLREATYYRHPNGAETYRPPGKKHWEHGPGEISEPSLL